MFQNTKALSNSERASELDEMGTSSDDGSHTDSQRFLDVFSALSWRHRAAPLMHLWQQSRHTRWLTSGRWLRSQNLRLRISWQIFMEET